MVKTAQYAWSLSPKAYLFFLAWLSIGVGILNLLPIPILDGGQILLLILTKFFKSLEKEHYKKFLFLVSFLVILGLMMLGILNDGFG
jgi:regulator of sigma E protease